MLGNRESDRRESHQLISVTIHMGLISAIVRLTHPLGGFDSVALNQFFFLIPFGLLITAIPIAPAGLAPIRARPRRPIAHRTP